MANPPSIRTWEDAPDPDSLLTYSEYGTSIFDVIDFLMNPPMVMAVQTTVQSQAHNAFTVMNWQQIDVDTHNFHSSSQASRFTIPVTGWYKGWLGASWAGAGTSSSGRRILAITKGSTPTFIFRRDTRGTSVNSVAKVFKGVRFHLPLTTGDFIEMRTYQDSTAAINTSVTDYQDRPEFYMRWWKPL